MHINDADRHFIENKYHRQDEPFDPYNRFGYHGYECPAETGLSDREMLKGLELLKEETKGETHALIKAKGFAYILDNMRIDVNGHDYFVCLYNWGRLLNNAFIAPWKEEALCDEDRQIMKDFDESAAADIWLDTEHFVPDWDVISSLGIAGLLERVKREHKSHSALTDEQKEFFVAMETEYEAVIRLLDRLVKYSEENPNEKTGYVSESLKNIRDGVPKTTLDILQLMYIVFMISEYVEQFQARSIGNGLDHTIRKFYQNDIKSGTFTKEEIQSFLAYFMLQFYAIGHPQGHPFYIGGMDENGNDESDELTYLILDVYESLNIYNPKIQVKINENTPDELIDRVLTLIRSGKSSFVFICQPGMIKSLTECYGATFDEARTADISGCNEMHIKGNEACMIDALPNMAKAIVFAINSGFDSVSKRQIGIKTDDFEKMKTFDEFYDAFILQMSYIIDQCIQLANRVDCQVNNINPCVFLTATNEKALKEVKDVYAFGVKYPNSALLICSFATAVDSLTAVKKLVFDSKTVSAAQLKNAVNSNWDGYESLRFKAKKLKEKYGNGEKESDYIAAKLSKWLFDYIAGKPNSRGGIFKIGVPSTIDYITQGKKTEATPDGRKMGEELSKNVAPVNGAEHNGITGYLNSAMKTVPKYYSEAFVVDAMLHPSAISGDDGIKAVRGLIKAYMKQDGISIQFNVFSPEMLLDAQKNPEKYNNLQVRVTGWNVLWNNMSKEEQEAYIERSISIAEAI